MKTVSRPAPGSAGLPSAHPTLEIAMPNVLTRIALRHRSASHCRALLRSGTALCAAVMLTLAVGATQPARALTPQQQLVFDIYKELVEINTVTETGDTGRAADAMAARLHAAGFDSA